MEAAMKSRGCCVGQHLGPCWEEIFFAISPISISSVRPLLPSLCLLDPHFVSDHPLFIPACLSLIPTPAVLFDCAPLLLPSINRAPSGHTFSFPSNDTLMYSLLSISPSLVLPVVTSPITPFEQLPSEFDVGTVHSLIGSLPPCKMLLCNLFPNTLQGQALNLVATDPGYCFLNFKNDPWQWRPAPAEAGGNFRPWTKKKPF